MYSPPPLLGCGGLYCIYMNQTILCTSGILCTLIVMSASFAYAQNTEPKKVSEVESTTTSPTITPTKRTFTTEPTLSRVAQTRLLNLAANMSNRMEGAVKRLQNVTDRLNSRLNKMEEQGKNVSVARTELAQAQLKLNVATQNIASIDTEVNAFVGSATPRENWQNLKNTYINTRIAIIAAHQNILATINLAQNATASPFNLSTSTSSTTATSTNN